jgi:HlyD family secretion protein
MTRARLIAAGSVLLVVAVAGGWWAVTRGDDAAAGITAAGTVEATTADLGFQAGGRIGSVDVVEGELVAVGQELARLESAELVARRSAAEAQLAAARALLSELQHGARPAELRQAQAAAAAARERLQEAERSLVRTRALEQGGAVSREALEQAQTLVEVARAQYQQAGEQLALVQQGPRAERLDAQRAAVQQAEAAVAQAEAALDHALIRAPFAGVVTVRHRQPGEAVPAGAPVLTVTDLNDRWVRIYVRQDRVADVSLGQAAEIRADHDRSARYTGLVTFIGSHAEFTPRNVQTTEQRVKLVYAVRVTIRGDTGHALKPGLPADVTLRPQ